MYNFNFFFRGGFAQTKEIRCVLTVIKGMFKDFYSMTAFIAMH